MSKPTGSAAKAVSSPPLTANVAASNQLGMTSTLEKSMGQTNPPVGVAANLPPPRDVPGKGVLCPAKCRIVFANAPGEAAAHHEVHFVIEAYDQTGARMGKGGDAFFVTIRGPAQVRCRVNDKGDGTYACVWMPPISGDFGVVVSSFGLEILPGTPFTVEVKSQQPYAPKCLVSGSSLKSAIARDPQSFDVQFKDRLGFTTYAVELDVYLERMPIGSPRPGSHRDGSPPATRAPPGYDSPDEDCMTPFVRRRNVRYSVKDVPLVIRASSELDSAQIGTLHPDQMFTVIEEIGGHGRVRAMIALESVAWHAEGIGVSSSSEPTLSPRLRLLPPAPVVPLPSAPPPPPPSAPSAPPPPPPRAKSPTMPPQPAATSLKQDKSAKTSPTKSVTVQPAPRPLSPPATLAAAPMNIDATSPATRSTRVSNELEDADDGLAATLGLIGWVTTVKDGKRFVTSKVRPSLTESRLANFSLLTCKCSPRGASCPPLQVRQSTESRQAHAEQWARRSATDRALSKSKAEKVARAESEGRSTSKGHEVYSRAQLIQSKISLELEVWGPTRILHESASAGLQMLLMASDGLRMPLTWPCHGLIPLPLCRWTQAGLVSPLAVSTRAPCTQRVSMLRPIKSRTQSGRWARICCTCGFASKQSRCQARPLPSR